MLTAHGVTPGKVYGGTPTLTAQDVAGMMAKCSDCESALLRAKYALEHPKKAWAYWWKHILVQGWVLPKGGVTRLADATLSEHLGGLTCKTCNGIGSLQAGSNVLTCDDCNGMGRRHWSNREMAKQLGLKQKDLREPWNSKVEWCRDELRRWEMSAVSKMEW